MSARTAWTAALAATGATLLTSCAPSPSAGGFDHPDPAARLYAIEQAAEDDDRSSIPHLVELLDSDDAAVRWLSIRSLERMTGTTNGYEHFDPPADRRAAIARWVADVEANRFGADGHG